MGYFHKKSVVSFWGLCPIRESGAKPWILLGARPQTLVLALPL